MKPYPILLTLVLMIISLAVTLPPVYADDDKRAITVTITNVTRGQIFSPPIVFSHTKHFELFDLGAPADETLYPLAEDGMTAPLENYLRHHPAVRDVVVAGTPLLPGESIVMHLEIRGRFNRVSAAGMMVTTNDAFFAIRGQKIRRSALPSSTTAVAYDAGSETNSELCATIPGPPCTGAGVRDESGAEGYVHVHAGIHGVGDLAPAMFDWRTPVAEVRFDR